MKLDVRFEALERLRVKLGAKHSSWTLDRPNPPPERPETLARLKKGIELESLYGPDGLVAGPGGLFEHRGKQVVIYIKDWKGEQRPEDSRRYHLVECGTIAERRREGQFERYVMTNRSDGLFHIDWIDGATGKSEEVLAALKVCQNCWRRVGGGTWSEAQPDAGGWKEKWLGFSLSGFLAANSTFFDGMPNRWDHTSPPNVYVRDWARISRRRRGASGWCCEGCGVDLSGAKHLLHCHHRSTVVTDNSPENLAVLCLECHAAQPQHGHMQVSEDDLRTIHTVRERGGSNGGGEDHASPPDSYVRDWARISRERREAAGWRCEGCGVDLSGTKHLLHCHHRNGVVTDNSHENLAVLCLECHAAQPQHGHMQVSKDDLWSIRTARRDAESDSEGEDR